MRRLVGLVCLLVAACDAQQAGSKGRPAPAAAPAAAAPEPPAPLPVRASPPGPVGGCDWTSFLGPQGTCISPETGILSPWPREGLRLFWKLPVGTGYGMPALSEGRLFLFDRHANTARLSCLKSDTTELLWKFEYPTDYADYYGYNNGPRCCPVVDGDRVYVYGAEGMLHCLHTTDGKLLWKVDTRTEFGVVQNFFGVASAPVIEGDLLLVVVGGSPKGSEELPIQHRKGNGTAVVAFEKQSGKVRYHIGDELAGYASPVLATIGGRRWCFVFARGGLLAFEPASGKIDFQFPWRARVVESVNGSNPIVVGDLVFISETYGPGSALLRVRPGGYDVVWDDAERRDKAMQCHWSTPIYQDGYLYGCSGRHLENAELRCIELKTGKVCWSQPGLTRTSLLAVDGHFVCLGESGDLRLLKINPRRYEEISRLRAVRGLRDAPPDRALYSPVEYPCWAAPILAHGRLYVRGKDSLACLELIPQAGRPGP
jgi:outer membrane protein assembly factor BamB